MPLLFKLWNMLIFLTFWSLPLLCRSKMTLHPDISFPSVEPSERRLPWPALLSPPPRAKVGLPTRVFLCRMPCLASVSGDDPHRQGFVKNRDETKRHCLLTPRPLSPALGEDSDGGLASQGQI